MIVCVLVPRFALWAALAGRGDGEGDDAGAVLSQPLALAPEPGRRPLVGDVSGAAEAFGVIPGMRVGEALARCPQLQLVPPDPEGVRTSWAETIDRLERIGAQVESDSAGEAYFDEEGLRGIHGGDLHGVLRAARRALSSRRPGARFLERRVRFGVAPSRFAAHAAALRARARRGAPASGAIVVSGREVGGFLAPLPVGLLRARPELAELPEVLGRLGVRTLGELAALPLPAVAERFGHPGLLAHDLARGRDTALDPRRPAEPVIERLVLPESTAGTQLERALELLIGRVLARPERRGRTLRAVALSARFVEGGTWRTSAVLREASADAARLRLVLTPKLAELPAPAESIGVEVEAFGPPAHDQGRLVREGADDRVARRSRIGEAVRQARQAVGEAAALRILEVDPDSRIPERRAVLAPYEDA